MVEEKGVVKKVKDMYVVFKRSDIDKYCNDFAKAGLIKASMQIEKGRQEDGKQSVEHYLVVNASEPYANDVAEIISEHDRRTM
jgi:hypothetical protein